MYLCTFQLIVNGLPGVAAVLHVGLEKKSEAKNGKLLTVEMIVWVQVNNVPWNILHFQTVKVSFFSVFQK